MASLRPSPPKVFFPPFAEIQTETSPDTPVWQTQNCRIVMVGCCSVKRLVEIIDYCIYGIRIILNGSDLLFMPAIFRLFLVVFVGCCSLLFAAAVAVKARISAVNFASLAVFSLHLTAITAKAIGRKGSDSTRIEVMALNEPPAIRLSRESGNRVARPRRLLLDPRFRGGDDSQLLSPTHFEPGYADSASSRSRIRSSALSRPIDRRMTSGPAPAAWRCSSVS
jgi:hypothetical protein